MKPTLWFVAVVVSLWSTFTAAQQPVYESTDKGGAPTFSDRPTQGSKSVTLPPPNVVNQQPVAQPQASPQPAAPAYAQLAIVAPAEQGTVHSNTGAFNVAVSVAPALNPGDNFVVTLDGTALPGRYTVGNIALTEKDFESAAADTAQHRLEVAVVDSGGKVLIAANPVSFYVKRSTVRRRGHR
jgi:hypothetical protein